MSFRTTVIYLIPLVFVSIHSKSIGSSENNVTKRVTKDDPFPDWVPFKNKHGEELGEFLQVETVTRKPKKRLALPVNFILRSVAEADPEDYFDKSGGDTYGEDYSDKREWADTFRPGKALDTRPIKHTELSEIDNVVGIITKHNRKTTIKPKTKQKERTTKRPKPRKIVDYSDDDEDEKHKPDLTGEDRSENEARKALMLESIDELKERHALEQKTISEKAKEEAMYTEERDRDNLRHEIYDKYGQKSRVRQQDYEDYDGKLIDKYKVTPSGKPTPTPLPSESSSEKSTSSTTHKIAQTGRLSVFRNPSIYMIYDEETTTDSSTATPTSISTSTTTIAPISSTYNTTTESTTLTTKFHAKITAPSEKQSPNKSERIALVPQDSELREGEPTLFFPKKIKRKGQNKSNDHIEKSKDEHRASSQEKVPHDELAKLTDAIWAGSEAAGAETAPDTTAFSETAPSASVPSGRDTAFDGTGPTSNESLESPSASASAESRAIQSGPSGAGETAASAASAPAAVMASSFEVTGPPTNPVDLDVVSASTKIKELKEMKKGEDHEHERGGEKEHHSEHHSEHGESGKKAYEGFHEDSKTEKGHHDKEHHKGVYDDHGGVDKEHHDERKHYGSHHHEEHGKKHAEYEESGKHSKGHSTKGSHDIHKKEEYEKKVEFFEEEGDSAEEEKHGGHHEETGHKKGGQFKKGNHDAGFHDRAKGDSGHFHKGGHLHSHKGHKVSGGHDEHGKHGASNLVEGGKKSGKKWIYHHGFPAKNANLVVIDRRTDQLYHGPQYYG